MWTPRIKRKAPFVIYDGGGVLQEVDQGNSVDFVAYTPFNPPPYGGTLVASGQYFQSYIWSLFGMTPVALRAYYVPIMIPYPMLIDQFSVYCKTAQGGKKCKIGIFSVERGEVSKNIYVNQLGIGSIGERPIPANVSLGAGSYAFFFMTDADSAEIHRSTIFQGLIGRVTPWSIAREAYHWYQDLSTFDDDLDDDPTLSIEETNSSATPLIAARMA